MNPVQFAAFLECSDALNVILRYIQAKCSKDSEGAIQRKKQWNIMHVSAFGKNLMSVVLDNEKLLCQPQHMSPALSPISMTSDKAAAAGDAAK